MYVLLFHKYMGGKHIVRILLFSETFVSDIYICTYLHMCILGGGVNVFLIPGNRDLKTDGQISSLPILRLFDSPLILLLSC